jgi:hypothetical protein
MSLILHHLNECYKAECDLKQMYGHISNMIREPPTALKKHEPTIEQKRATHCVQVCRWK